MLIGFIKFIHLLTAISLLGATLTCFLLVGSRRFAIPPNTEDRITYFNTLMLLISFITLATGTILVLPKHFSFHTPWIIAAYILTTLYILGISTLIFLRKKRSIEQVNEKLTKPQQYKWRLAYLSLLFILVATVHDAVTKTTFILPSSESAQLK